jgi:tRNA G18 (ribose-2'-O)-methylase SpoU
MTQFPVCILLHNVRSLYNVGAFFRTADAAAVHRLYLSGITGYPPQRAIAKTALGAEETVPWEHHRDPAPVVRFLREHGYELAAIETAVHAVDLFDWQPRFPVCLIFGHETEGISPELSAMCDTHVRIPMLGVKHSLNVATAGGVAVYELLRKYRNLASCHTRNAG